MLDVMSKLEAVYNALDANVWTIAFFGVLVPLIISCLWMVFFFFFAGVAVYIAIFLLILVLFATTGVCAYKGGLSNPFLDRLFIQSMEYAETVIWHAHCCARRQHVSGDCALCYDHHPFSPPFLPLFAPLRNWHLLGMTSTVSNPARSFKVPWKLTRACRTCTSGQQSY